MALFFFKNTFLYRAPVFSPQVEIEAPVLEDQKQDGRQPGEPKIADAVIPPSAEKPEGETVGADERIHPIIGDVPVAPESVGVGQEAITSQQDGENRKEESADVVVSALYLNKMYSFVHFGVI